MSMFRPFINNLRRAFTTQEPVAYQFRRKRADGSWGFWSDCCDPKVYEGRDDVQTRGLVPQENDE